MRALLLQVKGVQVREHSKNDRKYRIDMGLNFERSMSPSVLIPFKQQNSPPTPAGATPSVLILI
jgi:hypothetical protein